MVVEQLFQNSNSDPEMFDPSLCPICGVQYGGNLHNVPPQQGGLDSSYKRQKHNFAFLEFTSHHPFLLVREIHAERKLLLDKVVKYFSKKLVKYIF